MAERELQASVAGQHLERLWFPVVLGTYQFCTIIKSKNYKLNRDKLRTIYKVLCFLVFGLFCHSKVMYSIKLVFFEMKKLAFTGGLINVIEIQCYFYYSSINICY